MSMTYYDGDSPEEVKRKRRLAEALGEEAGSAKPLGHWTQALAQVFKGGRSGYLDRQAKEGERAGNESLMRALGTQGSAEDKIAALARTGGWGAPMVTQLRAGQIGNQLQHESPQGQLAHKTGELGLWKAQVEALNTQRQQDLEEERYRAVGLPLPPRAPLPPMPGGALAATPTPTPPSTPAEPRSAVSAPAQVPGVVRVPEIQEIQAAGSPRAAPAAPSPQPPLTQGFMEKVLSTRTPDEVRAWKFQFLSKNPAMQEKAIEKLYEWADPNKDQEKKRQSEFGEAQGKAQAALLTIRSSTDSLLKNIDAVGADPRLPDVLGWNAKFPTLNPKSVDVEERIKQLGGAAFLQAFEALKGGGAIQEKEGEKATLALSRLANLGQSEKGFRQALKEFRDEVLRLRKLAEDRAAGRTPMPSADAPTSAQPLQTTGSSNALPRVQNDADFDALNPGTKFIDPNGKIRVKP